MFRIKLISVIVMSLLVLIVVLQNTQSIETKLLFMTVTMPRAMLLLMSMLIGFVCGLVVAVTVGRRTASRETSQDK